MKALKELVQIITKHKTSSIQIIGHSSGRNTQWEKTNVYQFYDKLLNEEFESDLDASSFFFDAPPTDTRYKKLKSRLKNRLINTLFFINVKDPSYNSYEKAYYNCCKDMAAVKMLFRHQAREAGVKICARVFKVALKNEFTDLIVDAARMLRIHYGARIANKNKYNYYNEIFHKHDNILRAENLVEQYYTEIVINFVYQKGSHRNLENISKKHYQEIEHFLKEFSSPRLHFMGNILNLFIFSAQHDYHNMMKVCDKAINFFKQKDYEYKGALLSFSLQKLMACIHLRDFDKGKEINEFCQKWVSLGSFNWFKWQQQYFILSMHTEKYTEAYSIFKKTVTQKQFKNLPASEREMWKIYEGILHYLAAIEKITPDDDYKRFKRRFRLQRFLNEVPIFSKDKRGMNIPILIIQILFLILHKKYDEAIDRIEAINKYCSRHLKKDENFRSNCFIKMLLKIPIGGFERKSVIRFAENYRIKLDTMPLNLAQQAYEIEVIPYEDLWEFALDSLRDKRLR